MQETQEMWVWSLGQENPLDEEMAAHFSIQMEEPGRERCKELNMTAHTHTNWARQESDMTEHACMCARTHTLFLSLPNLSRNLRKHFRHKSELKRLEENKQESPSEFKESSSQDSKPFAVLIKTVMWMIGTKHDALWRAVAVQVGPERSGKIRYPDPTAAHIQPSTPGPARAASRSANQRPTLGPSIRRWRQTLRALLFPPPGWERTIWWQWCRAGRGRAWGWCEGDARAGVRKADQNCSLNSEHHTLSHALRFWQ